MSSKEHAVSWAVRKSKNPLDGFCKWSKYHWTTDSYFTVCGYPIVIGRDDLPLFPRTSDFVEDVTCTNCIRILGLNKP